MKKQILRLTLAALTLSAGHIEASSRVRTFVAYPFAKVAGFNGWIAGKINPESAPATPATASTPAVSTPAVSTPAVSTPAVSTPTLAAPASAHDQSAYVQLVAAFKAWSKKDTKATRKAITDAKANTSSEEHARAFNNAKRAAAQPSRLSRAKSAVSSFASSVAETAKNNPKKAAALVALAAAATGAGAYFYGPAALNALKLLPSFGKVAVDKRSFLGRGLTYPIRYFRKPTPGIAARAASWTVVPVANGVTHVANGVTRVVQAGYAKLPSLRTTPAEHRTILGQAVTAPVRWWIAGK